MSHQSSSEPEQSLDNSNASIRNSQIGQAGRDLTQINIVLSGIAELEQIALGSTSPLMREIFSRLLEQTNYFLERIKALEQAEKWLDDGDFRRSLALDIADTALKNKFLKSYPDPDLERGYKTDFIYNLYDCLYWLLEAFQTGIAKEFKYNFIIELRKYPLDPYVHALHTLKRRAKKDLRNKNVSNVVNEYIEMLIERIRISLSDV